MAKWLTFASWYNCQTGELTRADAENPAVIELPDDVSPAPNWKPYDEETMALWKAERAALPPSTAPGASKPSPKAAQRDKLKPNPPRLPVAEADDKATKAAAQPRASDAEVM